MVTGTSRDFDRWVKLTLRLLDQGLVVDYRDETGRVQRADAANFVPAVTALAAPGFDASVQRGLAALNALVGWVQVAPQIQGWLRDAYAPFAEQRYHQMPDQGVLPALQVPWLLPVFLQVPACYEALPWERWLAQQLLFQPDIHQRCVLMRLTRIVARVTAPPLPWVVLDHRGPSARSVEFLRQRRWFTEEPAVASHGLELFDARTVAEVPGERAPIAPHVTIEGRQRVPPARGVDLRERRLRVRVLDRPVDPLDAPADARGERSPTVSTLSIVESMPGGAISAIDPIANLVYALVHDFALHEVLWILQQCHPASAIDLATDPVANHALRLSSTMRQLRDDLLSGRQGLQSGSAQRASERTRAAMELTMNFTSERRGLTEMARLRSAAQRAVANRPPSPPNQATPAAPRSVEMMLDRYTEFGIPVPMNRWRRQYPLRCGWRYRLTVQIGQQDPNNSLFDEAPPPIDPLLPSLPPEQVHEIEVCVFAKTFALRSPLTQLLELPQRGPSNAVFFEICAPAQAGAADLRVVLYHRNNLLQSFVLMAEVSSDGPIDEQPSFPAAADPLVSVRLASSGLEHYGQWRAPRRRAMSVAVNDDLKAGQHTLMIKGDKVGIGASADDSTLRASSDEFHEVLRRADEGASFELTVRDMAKIGSKLWELLESRRQRDNPVLDQLRSTEKAETVQFVRHGSDLSLPWQTVYDLKVPRGDAFRHPNICMADTEPLRQPAANELGCRHQPGKPVICIEGFWSLRHRIEFISEDLPIQQQAGLPRADQVRSPPPHPLVALGQSIGGAQASALETLWRSTFGQRLHSYLPGDAPVDAALWRDELRPALLVLLSHMHEADPEANEPQRLYACAPPDPEHEISVERLLHLRSMKQPWADPVRPLVLLMACQSARRQVIELVGLTDAFLGLGASAVVGTEWDVLASEATHFAEHLAQCMLGKDATNLGEAMRRFQRGELAARRRMSFAFTAYGNADLTVV